MQLSELYLNRLLYKTDQTSETDSTEYVSGNQTNYPSSYIAYGGNSAIDVNTNTTTINGGKIRTGMVESTGYNYISGVYSNVGLQINLDTGAMRAPQFAIDSAGNAYFKGDISGASGTFSGNITVGTGNSVFKVFSGTGMWLGNAVFGSAPFRVDMAGNVTASSVTMTNASISTGSTWSGNQIADAYIGNLTAAKITSGTITIGGGSQPGNLEIIQSTAGGGGTTTSLLTWRNTTGGTIRGKIWTDSDGYMGYNAIGGRHYFYTNNNENVVIQDGSQTVFNEGISCRGSFNVGIPNSTTENARFTNNVYFDATSSTGQVIWGGSNQMTYGATSQHVFSVGGGEELKITGIGLTTQGYFYSPNSTRIYLGPTYYVEVAGANKTAIVPTSKGFKALYCAESPEVWFFDFCTGTRTEDIDPLFLEVTVAPYHFIMCEGGEYQVWGKRKGHEGKRFEAKTGKEFVANERFLSMNKPSYQFN